VHRWANGLQHAMDTSGPTLATRVEVLEGQIRQIMRLAEFRDLAAESWFRPGAVARLEFESRFRPIHQIASMPTTTTGPTLNR
jgi:hypothetical protein